LLILPELTRVTSRIIIDFGWLHFGAKRSTSFEEGDGQGQLRLNPAIERKRISNSKPIGTFGSPS
jgi:hypothetical protein